MLGWEQLAEVETNTLCTSVTTQRIGTVGAAVVELLLKHQPGSSSTDPSLLMSVADIHRHLRDTQRTTESDVKGEDTLESMDLKTLSILLETMRSDSTGMMRKVMREDKNSSSKTPCYVVNKPAILKAVRRSLIHAIAEERFGYQSARIVELLQCKNYLEQQKISDMAILPAKEGRERLYELFRNHWVDYIEVSKRGDFNPSSTYFFWTLSTDEVVKKFVECSVRGHLQFALSLPQGDCKWEIVIGFFPQNYRCRRGSKV